MASLTEAVLLQAVAAKMDLDSSASLTDYTADDKNEILVWALDGLKWLMLHAPEYSITSALTNTTTVAGAEEYAIPATCIKVVRVSHSDGDLLRYADPHTFQLTKTAYSTGSDSFGAGHRIWSDIAGTVKIFRETEGASDTITVGYLVSPAWTGAVGSRVLTVPNGWEGMVSDYCVVQAKMQDEEPAEAKLTWDMYLQTLSRFAGFEDIAKSVGG